MGSGGGHAPYRTDSCLTGLAELTLKNLHHCHRLAILQHPGGNAEHAGTQQQSSERRTSQKSTRNSVGHGYRGISTIVRHWTNRPGESALVYAVKSLTWILILKTRNKKANKTKVNTHPHSLYISKVLHIKAKNSLQFTYKLNTTRNFENKPKNSNKPRRCTDGYMWWDVCSQLW